MTARPSGTEEPSSSHLWLGALVATLLLQATAAFLTRLVPTIAPVMLPGLGWSDTAIGYLAAATTAGSIAFLLTGIPLIRRVGPIRALQIGMLVGAFGVAVLAFPLFIASLVASFLLGVGYGPSTPAGSEVLERYAPARHRNLIFSIKQAGVPVGGVFAGLTLPPIVEAGGWRATLVLSFGLAIVTAAAVQPLRAARCRPEQAPPSYLLSVFGAQNLSGPIRSFGVRQGYRAWRLWGRASRSGKDAGSHSS